MNMNNFNSQTRRSFKGRSIVCFPSDYVVIDIETTGLSPKDNEIIEIAAIKYKNNIQVDEFCTLVKPKYKIVPFISTLTGITNQMTKNSPKINDVILQFRDFVGKNFLVGYNVNFDVNFLYDNLFEFYDEYLRNNFIDVMKIASNLLPNLPRHRQIDIAQYYGISIDGAHRAKNDCLVCNQIFKKLEQEIIDREIDIEEFCKKFPKCKHH